MKTVRKFVASLLITSMMLSVAGNVYAAEPETESVANVSIRVGDSDYIVEKDLPIIEFDGEEYVVISINDITPNNISNSNLSHTQEESAVLSATNNKRFLYSDTVNLTSYGDYSSPEINCAPKNGFILRNQEAFFPQYMKIRMHLFSKNFNGWNPTYEVRVEFSVIDVERKLGIILESASDISKCLLEILKDGTTLSSPFSYSLFEY